MDRMRMVVEHLWWGPRRKGMTADGASCRTGDDTVAGARLAAVRLRAEVAEWQTRRT